MKKRILVVFMLICLFFTVPLLASATVEKNQPLGMSESQFRELYGLVYLPEMLINEKIDTPREQALGFALLPEEEKYIAEYEELASSLEELVSFIENNDNQY